MSDILDDLTDNRITAAHLTKRLDDWRARLDSLYQAFQDWLPQGWMAKAGPMERTHEQLMRSLNVASIDLPTLELRGQANELVRIRPVGLWIVGANGRVDMVGKRHFVILDRSEQFTRSDWWLTPIERDVPLLRLTQDVFLDALGECAN